MPEQDKVKDYSEGLQALIRRFHACWKEGEGNIVIKISDDKGVKEWSLSGGPTERSKRAGEVNNG